MFAEAIERPFESIESAQEYMNILAETTLEVIGDLNHDRDGAVRDGDLRERHGRRPLVNRVSSGS